MTGPAIAPPRVVDREVPAGGLSADDLATLLEVTRRLASPFDLMSMLGVVTAAARQVLSAERCSVWLHDPATDELVLEVATDIRHVRIAVGTGLVGACARDRAVLNVADCYADPRFDPGGRPALGLSDPLRADFAAGRSRRCAGRRDAGAEPRRRHLRARPTSSSRSRSPRNVLSRCSGCA